MVSDVRKTRILGTNLSLALLIFVVLLITLPFIGKAFHLDDTFFVWLAEEKLNDPLALGLPDHGYEGNFFSLYLDTHPPLLASYMALLIWMFGGTTEVGLHLGFLIFPALAAVSMFFLAKRFTDSPVVAALLLIVTPGFMVMSQSVMTDVPALSLWLATVASYVYAVDAGRKKLLIVAGVFSSLAILTTYQSFSLIPLLLLYALIKRRGTFINMVPLGAASTVFGAIILFYYLATGGPPKLSYSFGINMDPAFVARKFLSIVSVLGGALVFPAFLVVGMLKNKREYLSFAALVVFLFLVILIQITAGNYTPISGILQVIFYSAGILVVFKLLTGKADANLSDNQSAIEGDSVFLALWVLGVAAYSVILLPYASTRYLLPLFPPVILLFIRYARALFPDIKRWSRFAIVTVVVTATAGLAVSIADYQLSGIYRDFAATYPQKLKSEDHNIWFAGEFGLRYYLEANSARYLTRQDNSPVPGDYVVLSHELIAYFISDELKERLQLQQTVEYPANWPIRIQDVGSLAGFYDQFHGNLPYSISSGPIESIDIYVVK